MHKENSFELDLEVKKAEIYFWSMVNHEYENNNFLRCYEDAVKTVVNGQLKRIVYELNSNLIENNDFFACFIIAKALSETDEKDELLSIACHAGFDFSYNLVFIRFIDNYINSILLYKREFYLDSAMMFCIDCAIKLGWSGWKFDDEDDDSFEYYLKTFVERKRDGIVKGSKKLRVEIADRLRSIHQKTVLEWMIEHNNRLGIEIEESKRRL